MRFFGDCKISLMLWGKLEPLLNWFIKPHVFVVALHQFKNSFIFLWYYSIIPIYAIWFIGLGAINWEHWSRKSNTFFGFLSNTLSNTHGGLQQHGISGSRHNVKLKPTSMISR